MESWLANLCLQKKVEIVEDYNQMDDAVALGDDLTSSGWCLGMVIHWLRCKRTHVNFWDQFHNGDGKQKVRFIMARQQMINLKGASRDLYGKIQTAMLSEGMILQSSQYENPGHVSAANLYMSLNLSQGRYVSIIIGGPAGSHALGLHISQTQVTFMDPNAGEFVFSSRESFRSWLSVFLTGMDYFGSGLLSQYQIDAFN